MDIDVVNKIKRLAIIALASDDTLSEAIVLKGGNAIDLAYSDEHGAVSRTSFDLDFSLVDGDFQEDRQAISDRIEKTLVQTYAENGYVVLEYSFVLKPKTKPRIADFWGGYLVEFKVVEQQVFDQPAANPNAQRRNFIPLRPNHSSKFQIEFSKFEYMGEGSKQPITVDGYTVYVYTPEMIVFEKVRAICQQLPQYAEIIPSHTPRARARDFYDIHLIMESQGVSCRSAERIALLQHVFDAKRVPLSFLQQMRHHKALHRDDWENVRATVSQTEEVQDFDFYFDYVLDAFEGITVP
ncbi:nucleotidyl transferase AbiEii/AbiGii toxin family protein [Hymenobacter lapidiphilus]|uniref:Nucleotidyl transferase AbiEii/AbiGii toxin family protein n=1 Tax=Hymenobacter lapidiphilus TaxID=2608003 RepID=A0A7Y7PSB4_9BACT|nr:nucleotidyl transferase AbiEii/AbiGii toxin family protein [Hymenobacter lapidiphilus]NVO33113.1 nucleotidyl transferase AbiEii/AbiGii toxin family protein [Hymenobacter lapidiphilus]